jgi:hypothetical protein
MMSHEYQLQFLAYALQGLADKAFERTRSDHPLLQRVQQLTGPAGRLEISADVRTGRPEIARYDVPRVGLTSHLRLPASALCSWVIAAIDHIADLYHHHARRRLYESSGGLLGLDGLAPRVVGMNVVGGLSESLLSGWRSRVVKPPKRIQKAVRPAYEALAHLSSATARSSAGHVVVVGENLFHEVYEGAKIFLVSVADPRLLFFNGTFLYRDPYCHPDEAFVVPQADLRFYSSPPVVQLMRVPDAAMAAISVRSSEQLIAQRRYGLGRLIAARSAASEHDRR